MTLSIISLKVLVLIAKLSINTQHDDTPHNVTQSISLNCKTQHKHSA
jgi:hypothetical protein